MSLQQWHKNGWLRPHQTNRKQIADLFEIVDRDLADARTARLSSDWQFGIAYNAALKLCTILLYVEGYRPERALAHYRTLQALPLILGDKRRSDADYLDSCRIKRNTVEYDVAGRTSPEEAAELIEFTDELQQDVLDWLRNGHPELAL
ncbi:MAG: hypothetical protein GVY36_11975 [Verrucomicrobia bacterium]|jgi:hypothetical protein|nr:hypothetical protein [Verrucomicrobiota bacterium]